MADQGFLPPVFNLIKHLFFSEDAAHGLSHALRVEQLTREISGEPEFTNMALDWDVLSAAALLHDIGYTQATEDWSSDRFKHVQASVAIAEKELKSISPFDTDSDRLRLVCYLILHHDDTNYSFPIHTRNGRPAILELSDESSWPYILPVEREKAKAMLAILREADSRAGAGMDGAERTRDYSLSRGVPLFSAGNPLNASMWEESVIGNIRLAAKRGLLDATTRHGREIAWQHYLAAEKVVETEAQKNGVLYQAEVHFPELQNLRPSVNDTDLCLCDIGDWNELVETLRRIRLQGDFYLQPYRTAKIESRVIDIKNLFPLAYYILSSQIEFGRQLRERLINKYAFDTFDLSGIVRLNVEGRIRRIAPPIVEVYRETVGPMAGKEVWALVDGLHRCWVARELGFTKIRTVVISDVPKELPLCPMPLLWENVQIVEKVPKDGKKRNYRFADTIPFPDISRISSIVPMGDEERRYFFYRNLMPLGSSGIRKAPS